MFDLHGRVAVVTGASAGLGRQFALALARQGADLAILARREWKLNEVAEEIRAVGVKCLVVRCDVRLPEDVENAVKAVIAEYGKVDILVNNAGGGKCMPLQDFPEDQWIDTVNTDVFGVMRCTRDFGREMLKAGYGRVINIASILGKGGLPEIPVSDYATSKGAVINFTHQMAHRVGPEGHHRQLHLPGLLPQRGQQPRGHGRYGLLHQGPHPDGPSRPRRRAGFHRRLSGRRRVELRHRQHLRLRRRLDFHLSHEKGGYT